MNVQMMGPAAYNLNSGARNKVRQQGCAFEAYRFVRIAENARYGYGRRGNCRQQVVSMTKPRIAE